MVQMYVKVAKPKKLKSGRYVGSGRVQLTRSYKTKAQAERALVSGLTKKKGYIKKPKINNNPLGRLKRKKKR